MTRRWTMLAAALGLLVAAASCTTQVSSSSGDTTGAGGGTTSTTGTAGSTGTGTIACPPPTPVKHRPMIQPCPPSVPENGIPVMPCTSDADCTMPDNVGTMLQGKCGPMMVCDYDQCVTDSECSGDKPVCSCQGETRGYAGASFGSVCIPGNCHTDADCGSNGYCSPTVDISCGTFYGTEGWYCHTCKDTCLDDSDCPNGYCAYDPALGHWTCGYGGCAG